YPLSSHREVPEAVEAWVMDALARDPAARPASVASLLALLEKEVGHLPDEGRAGVRAAMKELWPSPADVAALPTKMVARTVAQDATTQPDRRRLTKWL